MHALLVMVLLLAAPPAPRVTMDLKGANVRQVLTQLGNQGKVNVAFAEDVKGEVTLVLKNVAWDQAMRQVLRAKGLDWRRDGNVVWIAPAQGVKEDRVEEFNRMWCTHEMPLPPDTFCKPVEPTH